MNILAQDLQIGDLVHINSHISWRVDSITKVTEKTVSYRATYERSEKMTNRVGELLRYSHRLGTVLEVDREERSSEPTEAEVMAAIETLSKTERYSVKDNDLDDWIA